MKSNSVRRITVQAALIVAVIALLAQSGGRAQPSDPLTYARGFLITGNVVAGGIDLPKAGATGVINFNAASGNEVPDGADVVAAYLYWETITRSSDPLPPATFRGQPVSAVKASVLNSLPGNGANCWGSAGGANSSLVMFRADVLDRLPKQTDLAGKWTGRYLVNDDDLATYNLPLHSVSVPQAGTGNVLTQSAGASLLIFYRTDTDDLRKIVLYDGVYAQPQGSTFTLPIRGLYGTTADDDARLTVIAGTGANNNGDRFLVNNATYPNPFPAPIDGSADRGWSNPTLDITSALPGTDFQDGFGETVTATIDHGAQNQNSTPYECVAISAIALSAKVPDGDRDGIPDPLESLAYQDGLKDPPTPAYPMGVPLPKLYKMGARTAQPDLFVEINSMKAKNGESYGSIDAPASSNSPVVVDADGHNHMPTPEVLTMVGSTYLRNGIVPHFDVGIIEDYHDLGPEYGCPANAPPTADCDHNASDVDQYLVPSEFARGGESINERACSAQGAVKCQFDAFPGTIGWPLGVQTLKEEPVKDNGAELTKGELLQGWTNAEGHSEKWQKGDRRRFDQDRRDYFHYLLFAHARGKSKSDLPCLDSQGNESGYNGSAPGTCAIDAPTQKEKKNPKFHVPSSVSGVAHLPGNTGLITLGLWDNFVGSPFVQASTMLHELGHQLALWHGGAPADWGNLTTNTTVEPNCKPNYLSSMSYLFQVHGLIDVFGKQHIDYSGHIFDPVQESSTLTDGALPPDPATPLYRPAWFVPADSDLAITLGASVSKRFCSGASWDPASPPAAMARVTSNGPVAPVDWNGDLDPLPDSSDAQDVNFDGNPAGALTTLTGWNDWEQLRLDQIGAGRHVRIFRNANGDFLDFGSGDFLDFGAGDFLDFGAGDFLDFGAGTYYVHMLEGDFLDFGAGDFLDFGAGDFLDFGAGVILSGASLSPEISAGDFLDFGAGDFLDFGAGDFLDFGAGDFLDFGAGDFLDFGAGDFLDFGAGTGTQDIDYDTAIEFGRPGPTELAGCVLGVGDCLLSTDPATPAAGDPRYHRVILTWKAPSVGTDIVTAYKIFRVHGTNPNPDNTENPIGSTGDLYFIDGEELPEGEPFTYFVRAEFDDDGNNLSVASPLFTINGVNEPPKVTAASYNARQGKLLTVAAPGVLTGDTDDDSLPTTAFNAVVYVTEQPSNGTVVMNTNGGFTYMPATGFFGVDTFSYRANDGFWNGTSIPMSLDSLAGTVTITVVKNNPPVCAPIQQSMLTGGAATFAHACTDADGDPITVTQINATPAPTLGTATLNANQSITYQSTSPKVGVDTFKYTVTDGIDTALGTVTVSVIYGFVNVANLPPAPTKTWNGGSNTSLKWQWTNSSFVAIDSLNALPAVQVFACAATGLAAGAQVGDYTTLSPGSGNSFDNATKKNSYTWTFNWKVTYLSSGVIRNLPAGTYVVRVKSNQTLQTDPAPPNPGAYTCPGTSITGALIRVQ